MINVGVLGDLGKALGQAAIEGAVKGLQKGLQNVDDQRHQRALEGIETIQQMENAASNGNVDAIQEMAAMYFNKMDYENAAYWALEGAAINDGYCMHLCGAIASQTGNYGDAQQWYVRNINVNNYSLSASNLGWLFMNVNDDPNIETSIADAEHYFKIAVKADSFNSEGALGLAICYSNSGNVNINQIKSLLQTAYNYGTGEVKHTAQATIITTTIIPMKAASSQQRFVTASENLMIAMS